MAKKKQKIYCPDCKDGCVCYGMHLKQLGKPLKTDWYGTLTYYKCNCCKTKYVDRGDHDLETVALS